MWTSVYKNVSKYNKFPPYLLQILKLQFFISHISDCISLVQIHLSLLSYIIFHFCNYSLKISSVKSNILHPTTNTYLYLPPTTLTHFHRSTSNPPAVFINLLFHTPIYAIYISGHAHPSMKTFSYLHLPTLTHDIHPVTPNRKKYIFTYAHLFSSSIKMSTQPHSNKIYLLP